MDVQSDVIKEEVFVKEESPFDWDFATGNSWRAPLKYTVSVPRIIYLFYQKKFLSKNGITGATDLKRLRHHF